MGWTWRATKYIIAHVRGETRLSTRRLDDCLCDVPTSHLLEFQGPVRSMWWFEVALTLYLHTSKFIQLTYYYKVGGRGTFKARQGRQGTPWLSTTVFIT